MSKKGLDVVHATATRLTLVTINVLIFPANALESLVSKALNVTIETVSGETGKPGPRLVAPRAVTMVAIRRELDRTR